MIVEQAVFGEVKGGHGLRIATGDSRLAAELASRLDLPDNAPPGVDWSPFLSGFPYREWYVVARTFSDPHATRAGMVLSHALIVPLDEVAAFPDLRRLLDFLISEPRAPETLATLETGLGGDEAPSSADLCSVAAALVTWGNGPLVRLGHGDFEALVAALWWRLWPSLRRGFAFRLSFSPGDLIEEPAPALVCTPVSLVARWQGHRVLDRPVAAQIPLVSAMLTGDAAGQPIQEFANAVGADLSTFADLTLLEQAYRLARLEPDTIGNTVAAIRLVERLSPDAKRGSVGKADLLDRLLAQMECAGPADVLRLRNLSVGAFTQAGRVWQGLTKWVAENVFAEGSDPGFRTALNDAFEVGKASDDWRRAVLAGISSAALERNGPIFPALWRWAKDDVAALVPLLVHLGRGIGFEDGLVRAAPGELSLGSAQAILKYATRESFYRLHAVTAAAAYDPVKAARLQLAAEPPSGGDGLRLALGRAEPKGVLAATIEIGDERLVLLAAEAVSKSPELLAGINLAGVTARSVWAAALQRNPEVWRGPSQPRADFHRLLNDLLEGKCAQDGLVASLADTPLGDLSEFPRRSDLWATLTGAVRERLLRATAKGWLANAAAGQPAAHPEAALLDVIVADGELDAVLEGLSSGRRAQAVQVVSVLPTFEEMRFRHWLGIVIQHTPSLPRTDAEAIGQIVEDRRWQGVADDLMRSLRSGRTDLRPALRACVSLVGFLERWVHDLTQVTPADKWNSLIEVAAELYPTGPEQEGLWERSGGRDADLGWGANGRARWHHALGQMRRGKGPLVDKLLREMQQDFPTNTTLGLLARDREFEGKL